MPIFTPELVYVLKILILETMILLQYFSNYNIEIREMFKNRLKKITVLQYVGSLFKRPQEVLILNCQFYDPKQVPGS